MLAAVLLAAALSLVIGFLLQRTRRRGLAWLFLLATIAATDRLLAAEPDGFRMLVLLGLAAAAMKALVGVEARRAGELPLPMGRWLAFAALWFGMQPRDFAHRGARRSAWPLAGLSLAWLAAGALTIVLVKQLYAWIGPDHLRVTGLSFIAGCSMVLHFGFIGLLAAILGAMGFATTPQFRAPWRAASLQEFWARRWNVGFSVMTTMTVYRPTVAIVGRSGALLLGFVASGLLHELACSLPVDAGYGLPSLYFLLHAFAVWCEHLMQRNGIRLRGWQGRLWVYAWVLMPVPLLFHGAFLRGVVLPLL